MAEPIGIEIVLRARNEASQALAQVQSDFERTTQSVAKQSENVTKATEFTSSEFSKATRITRLLGSQLAFELNPALGASIVAMSSMGRATSNFALPLTLLIGALAAGTAAFVQIIQKMSEMTAEQARLNIAVRQFDASAVEGALAAVNQRLEELRVTRDKGVFRSLVDATKEFGLGITDFFDRLFGASEQSIQRAEEKRKKFVEGAATIRVGLAPIEAMRATAEQAAALLQLSQAFKQVALARGDVLENERLELQIFAELQTKRDAELQGLLVRQKIERDRERDKTGGVSAVTLEAQAGERRTLQIKQAQELSAANLAIEEQARTLEIQRLETLRQIILLQGEVVLNQEAGHKLTVGDLGNLDELIAKKKAQGNIEVELLTRLQLQTAEITRQRELIGLRGDIEAAGIEQRKVGASAAQREQLELEAIESRRRTRLEQADKEPDLERRTLLRQQAEAEAGFARSREQLAMLERTNPLAGITAGFRDLADEFQSTGRIFREGILELGHDLSRAFSDSFFNVVTGDFKKLSQLPQQFALSLVRSVTDALGKLAVGSLFRSAGFGAFLPGLPALLAGGGGGNLPISAVQAAQFQAQGIPVGVSSTGEFAVRAASLGGGGMPGLPIPLPGGGLTSLLPLNAQQFLTTPFFATAAQAQGAAELAGIVPGTVAGFTPLQALGAGLGAVGLGLTILTALQTPPTPLSVISSTTSGALSGALIGSAVPVVGTVIGAIAGGILGGGAAAFGKKGGGKKKKVQTGADTTNAGNKVLEALNAAATLDDIRTIIEQMDDGTFGRQAGLPFLQRFMIVKGDPFTAKAASDFGVISLPGIDRAAPAAVSGNDNDFVNGGTTPIDLAIRDALFQRIQEIRQREATAFFAFEESIAAPGVIGGVARQTVIPFSERARAQGKQISVFEDSLLGLPDDVKAKLLLELARVDADMDLNIIQVDVPAGFLPVTVSTASLVVPVTQIAQIKALAQRAGITVGDLTTDVQQSAAIARLFDVATQLGLPLVAPGTLSPAASVDEIQSLQIATLFGAFGFA